MARRYRQSAAFISITPCHVAQLQREGRRARLGLGRDNGSDRDRRLRMRDTPPLCCRHEVEQGDDNGEHHEARVDPGTSGVER